jgi:hypothetical protein
MVNADSGQAVHSSERSDDGGWSRKPPEESSCVVLRLSFLFFFMIARELRLWGVRTRSVRVPHVGRDPQAAAHERGAPTVADHELYLLRRVAG